MGLRDTIRRLERTARGHLSWFELASGTRYYFDPMQAARAVYLYYCAAGRADCDREPRPEPPDVLKAVANAKDRRQALSAVMAGSSFLPVEEEALAERGEFVPVSLVAGRSYEEVLAAGVPDLSEP